MTDIKIKRYADKENLKKLMKYSKATFVNKNGDTLGDAAIFNFPDSGRDLRDPANVFPLNRGGLHWTGQSDWVTLQAVETESDCLDLQAQFGDSPTNNDGVNGFGIVDCLGNVNARIDCLGNATFKSIHSDTGVISSSDENEEQDITSISNKVIEAWKNVKYTQFRFIDDVTSLGDAAKVYFGVTAQSIISAFRAVGLDAEKYGLVVKKTDKEGNTHYGVRYSQVHILEAASGGTGGGTGGGGSGSCSCSATVADKAAVEALFN